MERLEKSKPAHAPSANPVAWDGISNPVWCVTQHFTTRVSPLCYLDLSRDEAQLKAEGSSKARYEPKRNALALLPLPSTFLLEHRHISPVAGPPGGHRRRPALLLLVCQDRRFWTTMMTPGPLCSGLAPFPPPPPLQMLEPTRSQTGGEKKRQLKTQHTAKPPTPLPPPPHLHGARAGVAHWGVFRDASNTYLPTVCMLDFLY